MSNEQPAPAVAGRLDRKVRPNAGYAVESLTWHPAEVEMPDAEITVLCWLEPAGEWFAGWTDGYRWYDAAHGGQLDNVTMWAEPRGPVAA